MACSARLTELELGVTGELYLKLFLLVVPAANSFRLRQKGDTGRVAVVANLLGPKIMPFEQIEDVLAALWPELCFLKLR